jgi:nascent polypeptide-associated complex subunit alpha
MKGPAAAAAESDDDDGDDASGSKQNRSEKKARKALLKLGLKPVSGITRVTMRKAKNITFNIVRPDVFKAPGADTYVIFGEAKIEDSTASQASSAAAPFRAAPDMSKYAPVASATRAATSAAAADDGDLDETGLEAKDIDLVTSQAGVTRAAAVKALKNNDGDIVNAILELTS